FVGSEDARRLARLADAPDRLVDHGLHFRVGDLAGVAERSVQVGRADEHAVDAFDRADRLDVVERALRLDLHQHADLLVRALGVVLDAAKARRAGRAGDAAHAGRR